MVSRRIGIDEVADDIRRQQKYLTGAESLRRYHRMVVGPVMVTNAIEAFLTATGPNGRMWKSGAAETKLGGRFSERYKKRPSGRAVTAGSVRNLDGGDLANAHDILHVDAKSVKVGPRANHKSGLARKIMQREAGYGNYAVGWDRRRKAILDRECQAFCDEIAAGKKPRYLPRSRVRRRVA